MARIEQNTTVETKKEHPSDCPGCIDCFYDDSLEAEEQRQILADEREKDFIEDCEGAGLIVLSTNVS